MFWEGGAGVGVRVEQVVEGWSRLWCGVGAGWCTGWWLWGYWGWLGWSWGKVRVEQVVEIVVRGLVRAGGGRDEAWWWFGWGRWNRWHWQDCIGTGTGTGGTCPCGISTAWTEAGTKVPACTWLDCQ